jgi:hypothetical protein
MAFCLEDSILKMVFNLVSNIFCQVLYKETIINYCKGANPS